MSITAREIGERGQEMVYIAEVKNDIVGLKIGDEKNAVKAELSFIRKGNERSRNKFQVNVFNINEIKVIDATSLVKEMLETIDAHEETIRTLEDKLQRAGQEIDKQRIMLTEKDADLQRGYRNDANRKIEEARAKRDTWISIFPTTLRRFSSYCHRSS